MGDISILVVDDNPVNLTMALGFLLTHNIKAETAASGIEAIQKIEEKAENNSAYDLVFMDQMMPGMDGLETTRHIRELEKKTGQAKPAPIIALSANAIPEKTFLEAGMNDYIPKPIDADDLNRVLEKWLPIDKQRAGKVVSGATGPLATAELQQRTEGNRLLEDLSQIKGLDVHAGLSHVGQNHESYFLALRQFSENCDSYLKDLNAALKAEAWEDYAIKAHALKGVLAAFGVGRLSQWAGNLERASKGELSFEICREETAPFSAALSKLQASLLKTLGSRTPLVDPFSKKEKPKGDENFLRGQIDLLRRACMECSSEDIEKITSALSEYEWDIETKTKLEKIRTLTGSYDFEETVNIIDLFMGKGMYND